MVAAAGTRRTIYKLNHGTNPALFEDVTPRPRTSVFTGGRLYACYALCRLRRINEPMLKISDSFSPLPEFGHRIQQGVMTLITIADGRVTPVGTGFTIAPDGLMMTAAHVIEEAMKRVVPVRKADGTVERRLEFYALYLTAKTHGENGEFTFGGLLPIHRVWYS